MILIPLETKSGFDWSNYFKIIHDDSTIKIKVIKPIKKYSKLLFWGINNNKYNEGCYNRDDDSINHDEDCDHDNKCMEKCMHMYRRSGSWEWINGCPKYNSSNGIGSFGIALAFLIPVAKTPESSNCMKLNNYIEITKNIKVGGFLRLDSRKRHFVKSQNTRLGIIYRKYNCKVLDYFNFRNNIVQSITYMEPVHDEHGWIWPRLKVGTSTITSGKGVFAVDELVAGCVIPIIACQVKQWVTERGHTHGWIRIGHKKKQLLDGHPSLFTHMDTGSFGLAIAMMINEASKGRPNCIFKRNSIIVQERIKPNEELTIFYGDGYERDWTPASNNEIKRMNTSIWHFNIDTRPIYKKYDKWIEQRIAVLHKDKDLQMDIYGSNIPITQFNTDI